MAQEDDVDIPAPRAQSAGDDGIDIEEDDYMEMYTREEGRRPIPLHQDAPPDEIMEEVCSPFFHQRTCAQNGNKACSLEGYTGGFARRDGSIAYLAS